MAIQLVDDHTLARLLRGERVREVARHDVATTGLWYLRLCQALEYGPAGRLSGPFLALPDLIRRRVFDRVVQLPDGIALVSLRTLAPLMARQQRDHPKLNLLAREVLAAAVALPASLLVAPGNLGPNLAAALEASRVRLRTTA